MLRSTAAAAALLSPHLNLQSSLWIDIKKLELADIFPKDLWVFCTHRQLVPCEKEAFNSALFGNDSKRHFLFFSCRLTRKIPRIPFCLLAFARSNFTLWEKKWAKNTTWRSPFGRLRNGAFFHPQRALNGITIKAVPNPWKNGSNPQEIHFLSLVFVSLPSSSWLFWEFCTTKSRRWYKRYKTCRKRRNRWMEIYSGKKHHIYRVYLFSLYFYRLGTLTSNSPIEDEINTNNELPGKAVNTLVTTSCGGTQGVTTSTASATTNCSRQTAIWHPDPWDLLKSDPLLSDHNTPLIATLEDDDWKDAQNTQYLSKAKFI